MRSRLLKPGFFTNEQLAQCSLAARLLFAGLWCLADREGRLEDRPARIKAHVFPYEDVDAEQLLVQLCQQGFVRRYEVDGQRLLEVTTFRQHQHIHIRELASTLPGPDAPGAVAVPIVFVQQSEPSEPPLQGSPGIPGPARDRLPDSDSDSDRDTESPPTPPQGGEVQDQPEKPEPKKKPQEMPSIPSPLDTPDFRAAWEEWLEYRRCDQRKPVKPRAARMQLKRLAEIGVACSIAAIHWSIMNDYQGLVEDPRPQSASRSGTAANGADKTNTKETGKSRLAARLGGEQQGGKS